MKIFVTGATGFVGEQLVKKLAENPQNEVHILVRSISKAKEMFSNLPNVFPFQGDLLEAEKIQKAMQECEQAYHLAAQAKVWDKNPHSFYEMNVQGTLNIVQTAIKLRLKRIVLTSTAGVLGASLNGEMITENTPLRVPLSTEYEKTKAQAEKEVQKFLDKGVEVVTVNPTRVYGGGQRSQSNAVTMLLEKYAQGKWRILPGNGKKIGNYVFIDDVVQGHLLAMQKGKNGERYILGGENVSYEELFETFAEITGKKRWLMPLPVPVMSGFAHLQMLKTRLIGSAPLITPPFVKKYLYDWQVSSQKAQKELGYTITPLKIGLQKTWEWLSGGSKG
ncbi:NAD-dependent epimerase/dehydratase family protein [Raineya orbicola]|jgi:nucleoside-diphosphate-sugar epimerase|uniref:Nucleoside-diphosphate-sugar epimerase n=1 Tax=Raineya orbicola TaxID=2016530 RepID=A0A2N3IIB4_9BACT|nr:NAD-dependent epimerase/dehydratase family protein [Raineya orbicola]PKQ70079.1 Nucleoside-diphosphate-sugar epimerase [Raineya orbicola]